MILLFCLLSSAVFFTESNARADDTSPTHLEFMPESRHSQYRTYSLLFDEQSLLIYRDGGHALGVLGGYITVLEAPNLPGRPELTVHGTASSYFTIGLSQGRLLTETIDARIGLAVDFEIDSLNRVSLIWTHQSGHTSDDLQDLSLFGSNLGNEIISFRYIHDIQDTARLGMSFRPDVSADPTMLAFGAEEFVEWFPWHPAKNPHSMAPFVGFSMEEYGHNSIGLTGNAMIGLASGNHLSDTKHPAIRVVLGYYSGYDTRLKYYEFLNSYMRFVYSGVQIDI